MADNALPTPQYDGHDHEQPWYSDCDAVYTGCTAPIGRKAHFWREYFATNLHERIQYRSLLDHILRDFAQVEADWLTLREDYGMRLTYCAMWCGPGCWWRRPLSRLRRRWRQGKTAARGR